MVWVEPRAGESLPPNFQVAQLSAVTCPERWMRPIAKFATTNQAIREVRLVLKMLTVEQVIHTIR